MARVLGSLVVATAVLAGCAHSGPVQDDQAAKASVFRLSREDVIEISVWKEPDLSRTMPIRPDGKVTLPLIGDVKAAGLTPAELENDVQKSLAGYVRDPHVTVIVHDVNGAKVFVTGLVGHPGAFPLRGQMGVLQALALAGGLGEFADHDNIQVLRADGHRVAVDYDDLVSGASKVSLGAGDTVVVQ